MLAMASGHLFVLFCLHVVSCQIRRWFACFSQLNMDTDINNDREKLLWEMLVVDECLRLQMNGSEHVLDALLQWREDVVGILKQATIEFEELNCIKDTNITVPGEHAQQQKDSWFAALTSLAVKFEFRYESQLAKIPPFDDCSPNKEATLQKAHISKGVHLMMHNFWQKQQRRVTTKDLPEDLVAAEKKS